MLEIRRSYITLGETKVDRTVRQVMGSIIISVGVATGAAGALITHESIKQPNKTVSEEVGRDILIGAGVSIGAAGVGGSILGGSFLTGLEIGR